MSEITLESLAQELRDLRQEVEVYHRTARKLDQQVEEFKNSNSSRRGLEGARGEKGDPGKDAVLKVIQQGGSKIMVVDAQTEKPVAELIAIEGPAGRDGKDGKDGLPGMSIRGSQGDPGPQGKPGRDGVDGKDGQNGKDGYTPSISELELLIAEAQISGAVKHHEQVKRG